MTIDQSSLGILLFSALTFVGIAEWLVSGSWRSSAIRVGITIFCIGAYIFAIFVGLHQGSVAITLGSIGFVLACLLAMYRGTKSIGKVDVQ